MNGTDDKDTEIVMSVLLMHALCIVTLLSVISTLHFFKHFKKSYMSTHFIFQCFE